MLTGVTSIKEISLVQHRFAEILRRNASNQVRCFVGHKGGGGEGLVYWLDQYGFWVYMLKLDNRYWNAFGTEEPADGKSLSIACELNFAFDGANRRVAGMVALDPQGKTVLAHRGIIGGGRPGIGKALFTDRFPGEFIPVDTGERVALVGMLDSPHFLSQLSTFVRRVERIKDTVAAESAVRALGEDAFVSEFTGSKEYDLSKRIEASCNHGVVVNNLAAQLREAGYSVANNRFMDLYTVDPTGDVTTIFEVKTDVASDSIYEAIGQLLYHSTSFETRPRLVMVLPESIADEPLERLNQLGIEVLNYRLVRSGREVLFSWEDPDAFMEGIAV